MKKGDIVFVQGRTIASRIIRLFDKGTFSHVAIAVNDSQIIEADVDTRVAIRPFDSSKYNIIEVIDLGVSLKQRQDIYESASKMIGTKYDYIQLLWYGLRRLLKLKGKNRLNNPKYVICSEMVFRALEESGILSEMNIGNVRGIDLTPNELYDLVKFVSVK